MNAILKVSGTKSLRLPVAWISRCALIVLLCVLSYAKLTGIRHFAYALVGFGLAHQPYALWIAYGIALAESAVALALIFGAGRTFRLALLFAAFLASAFFGFSVYRSALALPQPCGCVGNLFDPTPAQGMVGAAVLYILSIGAAMGRSQGGVN